MSKLDKRAIVESLQSELADINEQISKLRSRKEELEIDIAVKHLDVKVQEVLGKYVEVINYKLFKEYKLYIYVENIYPSNKYVDDASYTLSGYAFGWDGSEDNPTDIFCDQNYEMEFGNCREVVSFIDHSCLVISKDEFIQASDKLIEVTTRMLSLIMTNIK